MSHEAPETSHRRRPRIGLALSGGGFRAAFFHVGVLARLAELDRLRDVKIISCVSGGSLTGTLYYLELRRRLGSPEDGLSNGAYAASVKAVRDALLRVGRANVRGRVFLNPAKNLSMFLSPRYSRTDRAGDLLDRFLCRRIYKTEYRRIPFVRRQVELRYIGKAGLPRFILNATTLNSGHNWRFMPEGMGDRVPADSMWSDIDRNDRLQWTKFEDVPPDQEDLPLGLAVAASAAFPGLFRPLALSGMYEGYRVDLMDGGAQDNQGVQALFDYEDDEGDLDEIIVSDGSGQLADQKRKGRAVPSVIQRVISVGGDRIREEQLLRPFRGPSPETTVIHLRHGLDAETVTAIGLPPVTTPGPTDTYSGVNPAVQALLAETRTDLDAFGSRESHMLIADGYLIASARRPAEGANVGAWVPAAIAQTMGAEPHFAARRLLKAGAAQIGKPWNWFPIPFAYLPVYGALIAGLIVAGWKLWQFVPDRWWGSTDRWWAAAAYAAVMLLVPFLAPRAIFWGAGAIWPWILSRRLRPALWVLTLGLYAGILGLVYRLRTELPSWLEADWATWEVMTVSVALLALPAVAPSVLALLMLAEGWLWKRLGRC